MDGPAQLLAIAALLVFGPVTAFAEEAAPKRGRAISSHVADVLKEAAAQITPPSASAGATSAEPATRQRVATSERAVPANGIVRLPAMYVRERKPPTPEEVMTEKELARYALEKYYGDESGFHRGLRDFLNLPGYWKKIPVLGAIPLGFMTSEELALQRYQEERRRERWADMMSLLSPAERARVAHPEQPPPPAK